METYSIESALFYWLHIQFDISLFESRLHLSIQSLTYATNSEADGGKNLVPLCEKNKASFCVFSREKLNSLYP